MSDIFILTLVWDRQDRVDMTAPENITQICMECDAHISGPNPPLSRKCLSHGLCKGCGELWKKHHEVTVRAWERAAWSRELSEND